MKELDFKKLRFKFVQKCFILSKHIRIQDWERKLRYNNEVDKNHYLLKNILSNNKSYFTLINHDELLRYPIENDDLTELRFDLDYKKGNKEQNIKQNILLGRILYLKLKEKGFEPSFYYSGGKGLHAHILINTKGLNFKHKLNCIDLIKFDKEFKQGNKTTGEYNKIILSNKERSNFKKKLIKWLNLEKELLKNLDFQMCSSLTLLTLEGAKKRKEGSKFKTKIDYSKYSVDEIFNYIKSDYEPYIDFNFFNKVKELSEGEIEEISQMAINDISIIKKPLEIDFEKKAPLSAEINKKLELEAKIITLALYTLVKEKEINSTNEYLFKCAKIYYFKLKNEVLTIKYLTKLNSLLSNNKRNVKWFEDKINSSKIAFESEENRNNFLFAYKNIFSESDFEEEFNKSKNILTKNKGGEEK